MCRCLHSARSMFFSTAEPLTTNAFEPKAWLWHQRAWRAASQIPVGHPQADPVVTASFFG